MAAEKPRLSRALWEFCAKFDLRKDGNVICDVYSV